MNSLIKKTRFFILTLLLVSSVKSLYSQDTNPTVTFSATADVISNPQYSQDNGFINIYGGASYIINYNLDVTVNVNSNQVLTEDNLSGTYNFGEKSGALSLSVLGNKIIATPLEFSALNEGEYTLSFSINYSYKEETSVSPDNDQNESVQTISGVISGESPDKIKVWPKASVSLSGFPQAVFVNSQITGSVIVSGGNPDGWTYNWTYSGQKGTEFSYIPTSATTLYLGPNAKNTAPGSTILWWGDMGEQMEPPVETVVVVYPTPNATPQNATSSIFSGEQVTLRVVTNDGNPEGWSYSWNWDTPALQGSSSDSDTLVLTGLADSNIQTGLQVTCMATNTAYPGGESKQIPVVFNINVYPTPTMEWASEYNTNLLNEDQLLLSVTPHVGETQDWTYQWNASNSSIINGNGANVTLTPVYTGNGQNSQTLITVTGTYKPAGTNGKETQLSKSFTVWPTPSVEIDNSYHNVIFTGQEITLSLNTKGGNPEGWTYTWSGDGVSSDYSNSSSIQVTPTNNTSNSVPYEVKVTAHNNYGGTKQWDSPQQTFTITVWPDPQISWNEDYNTNLLNGNATSLSVTTSGGDPNPSAWSYQWSATPNSTISETGSSATLNPVNTNMEGSITTTVTVTATNIPSGIYPPEGKTVKESKTFTVWPTPQLTENYYNNVIFSGENLQLSVTPQGGNPEGWTYSWVGSGVEITNRNEPTITIVPTNLESTSKQVTVTLTASNNYGGTQAWTDTKTFTITVWPDPQIAWGEDYNTNLLNGIPTSLSVTTSGGDSNPSAWSYQWETTAPSTINGERSNATLNPVNNSEGSLITTVTIKATNTPEGIYPTEGKTVSLTKAFTIWPTPSVAQESYYEVVYSGTDVELTLTPKGGKEDGWTYSWSGTGVSEGNTNNNSITVHTENTGSTSLSYTITAIAYNNYGGTNRWESSPQTFTIVVWPLAQATWSQQDYPLNVLNGDTVGMEVTVEGGDSSKWTYNWSVDSPSTLTSNTSKGETFNAVNTQENGSVQSTVTVIATNTPEGIQPAAYFTTLSHTFTVWPIPSVTKIGDNQVVFSGSPVTLTLQTNGGNQNGWSFEWSDSNGLVTGNNINSKTITVTPTNTGSSSQVFEIKVKAHNNYGGNSQWDSIEEIFTITVWPAASAEWGATYPIDIINGTSLPLNINTKGGDPDAWQFDWTVGSPSRLTGEGANNTFQAVNTNTNGSLTSIVNVKATNSPANLNGNPYTRTLSHTFTVWPSPQLESKSEEKIVVFNGTSIPLYVTMQGGVENSWTYEWKVDGVAVGMSTPTYTYVAQGVNSSSSSERVVTVTVKNYCNGAEAFTETYTFNVTIWPTPNISFGNTYVTDIINGETVAMNINVSGGNEQSWTYEWTLDGRAVSSNDYYVFEAENSNMNGSISRVVNATAINTPEGINNPYRQTLSHIFNVWPLPALQSRSNRNIAIYSGTTLPLSVTMQGGVSSGWSYQWEYKGETVSTGPSYTFNERQAGTFEIVAHVQNICNGAVVFEESYDFEITVYNPARAVFGEDYPTDVISGTKINMEVATTGGSNGNWSYIWRDNNNIVDRTQAFGFEAENSNENGSVSTTISVTATNTPPYITESYTTTLSHTYTVWPVPAFVSRTSEHTTVYTGTQVPLNITMRGGVNTGWNYEWEYMGNIVGTGQNYTFDASTAGLYGIVCYVRNTCNGEIVFSERYDFEIQVWDIPVATMSNNYPTDVINGTSIPMEVTLTGGEYDRWNIEWRLNNQIVSSEQNYYYTATTQNSNEPQSQTVIVSVQNSPSGIAEPYDVTFEHTYNVWPSPRMASRSEETLSLLSGEELTMYVNVQGGYNQGWSYQWSLNGSSIAGANSSTYQSYIENSGETMSENIYTLHAVNTLNGVVVFDETYDFYINIYPVATANLSESQYEVYYGETVNPRVIVSGGNPDGWTFNWTTPDNSTNASATIEIPSSPEENYVSSYNVNVRNVFEDQVWYSNTLPVNITGWSRGNIEALPLDSLDYNYSAFITLETEQAGGYTGPNGGWNYSWTENNTNITGNKDLELNLTNNNNRVASYIYRLKAENILNGIIGSSTNLEWSFRIWPQIIAPEEIIVSSTNVRSSDLLQLGTYPTASGGYTPNGDIDWEYVWRQDGKIVGTGSSLELVPGFDEIGMGTYHLNYELEISNRGPNGTPWFQEQYISPQITVYASPVAPTSLTRKGDGTSCTMVAMSSLNDEELDALQYNFVFGYTDAAGNDHPMAPIKERYQRFEPDIYNNNNNTFWVYTQWNYRDGSTVTSGKRYLNGSLDEDFDGSVYSGESRSDNSDIDQLYQDSHLRFDGFRFTAELVHESEAKVRIYSMDGALIRTFTYPKSFYFDEMIDYRDMPKGIYVVDINVGKMKTRRKVVVNN